MAPPPGLAVLPERMPPSPIGADPIRQQYCCHPQQRCSIKQLVSA
jgi:hypothetical protein